MNQRIALLIEPLEPSRFAPFGDVIEAAQARTVFSINTGTAQRFHDLAHIDTAQHGGRTVLSIFRAQPRRFPFAIDVIERHPLGSQAFYPLSGQPYLVIVSESPTHVPRAFAARADQGVNFHPGTWHHALIALNIECDFLVIDRDGGDENCDEAQLSEAFVLLSPDAPAHSGSPR
ncbi:MAG: ureidoglycolate lyase [Xanthomonadales bacterium]|jgi:ureidoglycolate lyase|nr:ureidoglycolate lyase [Xanthomonadales bacterium]